MFGMPEAILDAVEQGMIRSIQRGASAGAGNVVINSVNPGKAMVLSKSKGSSGYVAARGGFSAPLSIYRAEYGTTYYFCGSYDGSGQAIGTSSSIYNPFYMNAVFTGGSTDLTVKEFSAKLVNATTISCDGACEWEVVEFV